MQSNRKLMGYVGLLGGEVALAAGHQRIEWVTDRDRFAAISDAWRRLTGDASPPFSDHSWFAAWWDAFGTDGGLRVCLLWKGEELLAALPVAAKRSWMRGLANSETPTFLVPARDERALDAVIAAAFDTDPEEITLHAVCISDALRERFIEASARRNRVLLQEQVHRSPRVQLGGDFEQYELGRRRRLRNILKQGSRLAGDHAVEFRFDSAGDLEDELQRAFDLEAAGWKGRAGSAILSSAQLQRFYKSLARAYHARGELRFAWLLVDGEPAAFILTLVREGRVYGLKGSYDERLRRYSPGLLIVLRTIERCFQLGLESYELLGRDDPWKAYFANAADDYVRLRSYSRRPLALSRYAVHRAGRPVVRKLLDRPATKRVLRPAANRMRNPPSWRPL
jgi:CelD/BcsL family acetyltransferase involved in cellulose biosynthesis